MKKKYTVRIFLPTPDSRGSSEDRYLSCTGVRPLECLDLGVRSISFKDSEGRKHVSNLPFHFFEQGGDS